MIQASRLVALAILVGSAWLASAGAAAAAAMDGAGAGPETTADVGSPTTTAEKSLNRRQELRAVWGGGRGEAWIRPFVDDTPDFSARIRVTLERAKPNTIYVIQRAPESGRSAATDRDGRCQRAFALPPWSATDPPAPSFATFVAVDEDGAPVPGVGPILLGTNRGGFGRADFIFHIPAAANVVSGDSFDVVFRVLDDLANPTSLLLGECVTVQVP